MKNRYCCQKPVEQCSHAPPIVEGKWEEVQTIIGDYEGITYSVVNPLEVKSIYTFKQNGKYVEAYVNKDTPDLDAAAYYLVWEKQYDTKMIFMGWVLKGVSGNVLINYNVKDLDRNNYAMELEGSSQEVGENNARVVYSKRLTF